MEKLRFGFGDYETDSLLGPFITKYLKSLEIEESG